MTMARRSKVGYSSTWLKVRHGYSTRFDMAKGLTWLLHKGSLIDMVKGLTWLLHKVRQGYSTRCNIIKGWTWLLHKVRQGYKRVDIGSHVPNKVY